MLFRHLCILPTLISPTESVFGCFQFFTSFLALFPCFCYSFRFSINQRSPEATFRNVQIISSKILNEYRNYNWLSQSLQKCKFLIGREKLNGLSSYRKLENMIPPQNNQTQKTQVQNTQAQNTRAQNTQALNTQGPKIPNDK